jgi:hypothetical protein
MTTKKAAKKKPRVRVVKVTPHVAPDEHEIVARVYAPDPPPADLPDEPVELDADAPKKHGFWAWLLGE